MRSLTWLIVAIVVAAVALPATAGEITVGKRGVPSFSHVGDTITWEMWVDNPNDTYDLLIEDTWDVLAPGTPAEVTTAPVVPRIAYL